MGYFKFLEIVLFPGQDTLLCHLVGFHFYWTTLSSLPLPRYLKEKDREVNKAEPSRGPTALWRPVSPPPSFSPLDLPRPFRRLHLHSRVRPPPVGLSVPLHLSCPELWCTVFRMISSHCRTVSPPPLSNLKSSFWCFISSSAWDLTLVPCPSCLAGSIREASRQV